MRMPPADGAVQEVVAAPAQAAAAVPVAEVQAEAKAPLIATEGGKVAATAATEVEAAPADTDYLFEVIFKEEEEEYETEIMEEKYDRQVFRTIL
jgi:hypothetical protein